MKLSFDGVRKRLAEHFNELVETELSYEQREIVRDLRQVVGGLLCAFDPRDQPDDCNMLADQIELLEIPDVEGDEEEQQTWRRHNMIGRSVPTIK